MKKKGDKKKEVEPKQKSRSQRIKASHKFITALALVSIISFLGIVSYTLFNKDISVYVEALWMLVIGIGLIVEAEISTIKKIKMEGLTPSNFTHLTTLIIGAIAILTGIFSLPIIRIEYLGFLAVKGVISIIAIIIIIVQTWIIE